MNVPKCTKSGKNRFGRQKTSAILLTGCKKTRLTRRFSQERRSRPKVFFEKLLPLKLLQLKHDFSSEKAYSAGIVPAIATRAAAGASRKFGRFSLGKPVFFKLRGPCELDCCSTKSCSRPGLAAFYEQQQNVRIIQLSNEMLLPLGFGSTLRTTHKTGLAHTRAPPKTNSFA